MKNLPAAIALSLLSGISAMVAVPETSPRDTIRPARRCQSQRESPRRPRCRGNPQLSFGRLSLQRRSAVRHLRRGGWRWTVVGVAAEYLTSEVMGIAARVTYEQRPGVFHQELQSA